MIRSPFKTAAGQMAAAIAIPALSLALLAIAPASAQTSPSGGQGQNSLAQLCSGAGKKFDCNDINRQVPQDKVNQYLQGSNAPDDVKDKINQQIKDYQDKLNQGNLPGGGQTGTGQTPTTGTGTTPQAPDMQQLRDRAQQYLGSLKGGNGGQSPSSGGGQKPEDTGTGKPENGTQKPKPAAKSCEEMQAAVNERVAKLNKNAQAQLANMSDVMNKLKDYQSQADPSKVPQEAKDAMQQAEEKQAAATQAVATLAALSVNLDCSQQNPAQGLSVIKTATDDARKALKEFRKSLSDVTKQLQGAAKP